MALKEEDETLQLAMRDFGLLQLPNAIPEARWNEVINGIALVRKINGNLSYVKVGRDKDNHLVTLKDYGSARMIVGFLYVYPVNTLDTRRFKPDLRSKSAMLRFLVKNGYNEQEMAARLENGDKAPEQIAEDKQYIKALIDKECVRIARETLKEDERCKNLIQNKDNDD